MVKAAYVVCILLIQIVVRNTLIIPIFRDCVYNHLSLFPSLDIIYVLCFCHFPMWCLGSGVVLNCIDS